MFSKPSIFLFYLLLFSLTTTSKCPNDKRCAQCEEDDCQLCNYSYLDDGRCKTPKPIIDHCLYYINSELCLHCEPGYANKNNVCEKIDIEDCLFLNILDKSKCDICANSILVDPVKFDCSGGRTCKDVHCENCWASDVCLNCKVGYAINKKSVCVEEPTPNCLGMLNEETKCSVCEPDYYDSNEKCLFNIESVLEMIWVRGVVVLFVFFSDK